MLSEQRYTIRWVPLFLNASSHIQIFIAYADDLGSSCFPYSSASFSDASSYAVEARWDQPARQPSSKPSKAVKKS